jgi:hypothetical protein
LEEVYQERYHEKEDSKACHCYYADVGLNEPPKIQIRILIPIRVSLVILFNNLIVDDVYQTLSQWPEGVYQQDVHPNIEPLNGICEKEDQCQEEGHNEGQCQPDYHVPHADLVEGIGSILENERCQIS